MEKEDAVLWRLARLHPLLVTSLYWGGFIVLSLPYNLLTEDGQIQIAIARAASLPAWLSYPLFVRLFISGRFASRSQRSLWLPLTAMGLVGAFSLVVGSPLIFPEIQPVLESGSLIARLALWSLWLGCAMSIFYLLIGAATALIDAERGPYRTGMKTFGAFLLFAYLPIGIFFLHRRIRRLVQKFDNADPIAIDLPMERLVIERMASGHLCLELTERPSWESFERYAEELLCRLDGRVMERGSIVDMHLWNVEIETVPLRLVYEDLPNRVCLESDSYPGDMLLTKLQTRLTPSGGRSKEAGPSPASAGGAARVSKDVSEG